MAEYEQIRKASISGNERRYYDDLVNTVDGISRFAVPEKTVLCTFNFIGLSGEEVFIEEDVYKRQVYHAA